MSAVERLSVVKLLILMEKCNLIKSGADCKISIQSWSHLLQREPCCCSVCMKASCTTFHTFAKCLQYADVFTKIRFSCAGPCCRDLFGQTVIHIPLDRMDTAAPCRVCKNHFPTEVHLASTDTLTCVGLMPPY